MISDFVRRSESAAVRQIRRRSERLSIQALSDRIGSPPNRQRERERATRRWRTRLGPRVTKHTRRPRGEEMLWRKCQHIERGAIQSPSLQPDVLL